MVSNLRLENGDNIGALASGEAKWHTDSCYKSKRDTGSLLYALEVPDDGGKTAWANTQLAYEALSEELRARVEGRRGEYAYNFFLWTSFRTMTWRIFARRRRTSSIRWY